MDKSIDSLPVDNNKVQPPKEEQPAKPKRIYKKDFFAKADELHPELTLKEVMSLKTATHTKLLRSLKTAATDLGVNAKRIDLYIDEYINNHIPKGLDKPSSSFIEQQEEPPKVEEMPPKVEETKPKVVALKAAKEEEAPVKPTAEEQVKKLVQSVVKNTPQKVEERKAAQALVQFFIRESNAWRKSKTSRQINRILMDEDKNVIVQIADYRGFVNGLLTLFGKRKHYLFDIANVRLFEMENVPQSTVVIGTTAMQKLYRAQEEKLRELAEKYALHLENKCHE